MILKARHLIPFKHNILNVIVLLISVLMLLGSASRNAISSLIVYAICYGFMSLKETPNRRYFKLLLECLLLLFLFVFFVAGASNIPLTDLLNQSNRETLFEVALPTFFSSTRTMIGLGLASNEIYGMNLTPYQHIGLTTAMLCTCYYWFYWNYSIHFNDIGPIYWTKTCSIACNAKAYNFINNHVPILSPI